MQIRLNSCKRWMGLHIYINQPPQISWTSRQTKGYMTVTAHFITVQWQLHSRLLSTTLVEGSNTAHKLASGMQQVFQAQDIIEKVKTITSDNPSNVKAAVELLQVRL